MADATKAQNPRARKLLTQERLKEVLRYDPETGDFHRIGGKRLDRIGEIAGHVERRGSQTSYLRISVDCAQYYAHQLAWFYMTGDWPDGLPDHKDCDGLNNRWENLRHATPKQNGANHRVGRNNTSGYKNVSFDHKQGKWRPYIAPDGHQIHLGYFKSKHDAATAAFDAAVIAFGEFARQ